MGGEGRTTINSLTEISPRKRLWDGGVFGPGGSLDDLVCRLGKRVNLERVREVGSGDWPLSFQVWGGMKLSLAPSMGLTSGFLMKMTLP